MSKTFTEELEQILYNYGLYMGGGADQKEAVTFEQATQQVLKLVEERIIGEDREYEKYAKCPNGCYAQYSCRCDSAEHNVKSDQRQRLYEGVEE